MAVLKVTRYPSGQISQLLLNPSTPPSSCGTLHSWTPLLSGTLSTFGFHLHLPGGKYGCLAWGGNVAWEVTGKGFRVS